MAVGNRAVVSRCAGEVALGGEVERDDVARGWGDDRSSEGCACQVGFEGVLRDTGGGFVGYDCG